MFSEPLQNGSYVMEQLNASSSREVPKGGMLYGDYLQVNISLFYSIFQLFITWYFIWNSSVGPFIIMSRSNNTNCWWRSSWWAFIHYHTPSIWIMVQTNHLWTWFCSLFDEQKIKRNWKQKLFIQNLIKLFVRMLMKQICWLLHQD